jgi:hypothetical protein
MRDLPFDGMTRNWNTQHGPRRPWQLLVLHFDAMLEFMGEKPALLELTFPTVTFIWPQATGIGVWLAILPWQISSDR